MTTNFNNTKIYLKMNYQTGWKGALLYKQLYELIKILSDS